jgi:hypothetical protein
MAAGRLLVQLCNTTVSTGAKLDALKGLKLHTGRAERQVVDVSKVERHHAQ